MTNGIYSNIAEVPDASMWRHLQSMGFDWRKPVYSDPRANSKRDMIEYERCVFRLAQDNGLDPTTLLSLDETNFYYKSYMTICIVAISAKSFFFFFFKKNTLII